MTVRILGIDPGSRFTGFGVVDVHADKFVPVDYGVIVLGDKPFHERLHHNFIDLLAVIDEFKPTQFAIEQVFVAKNPSSALKLGHARGAAILAATNRSLEPAEYSALQIKKAVVGQGRADKSQMQKMVTILLGLSETPSSDAADALAVSLCHAQSLQGQKHQLGATFRHKRRKTLR